MKNILLSANIVIIVLLLSACSGRSKTSSLSVVEDTIPLKYAENLLLTQTEDYIVARLKNPWDSTGWLRTYILVDKDKPIPAHLPEGTVVRTPLDRSLVYTAVHCSLLERLGAISQIAGVCDLNYIQTASVVEKCKQGLIADVGMSLDPDIEKVIDLHPDGILLCPFENSGGFGRIGKLDIPIIECADYMETSALGCAEWMRFYGLLFHRTAEADSIFQEVERNYNSLKLLVANRTDKPKVMCELKTGSAWYVPGGNSTTGRFYSEAGGEYLFADYQQSGAVPLSFETVFDKAQKADVWLIKYNQPTDKTYSELEKDYAPYVGFRAFKERNIYGCNTAYRTYYEDFPFHPDLLLKDLIKIFHPTLLPEHTLKYYTKLTE
ncbi:MAG: ABC transporter substrate-binding protein [Bacteroides sp.]|nr:ABC transporter substrate-binding protein [Bacteroides sp.]